MKLGGTWPSKEFRQNMLIGPLSSSTTKGNMQFDWDGLGWADSEKKVTLSLHEWDGTAPIRQDPFAIVAAKKSASEAELIAAAKKSGLLSVSSWAIQLGSGN